MTYDVRGFTGTVVLKEAIQEPIAGGFVRGVHGRVSIIEGREMIGFDPGKNEANWVARVEGAAISFNFPGCQVRSVIAHEGPIADIADYLDLTAAS